MALGLFAAAAVAIGVAAAVGADVAAGAAACVGPTMAANKAISKAARNHFAQGR